MDFIRTKGDAMKRALGVGISILFLLLPAFPAAALELGARGAFWYPASDEATIQVDNGGAAGTKFDFKDDLGVGSKAFPWIEAWFGLGKHSVTVGYFRVDNSGDETLGSTARFNGVDFANQHVDFDTSFRVLNLTYGYRLLDADVILAGLSLTALFDLKYLDIYSKMEGTTQSEDVTRRAVVASVGAKARASILADLLWAKAAVLMEPFGDRTVGDFVLELGLSPLPLLDLHLGWRTYLVKIDESDFQYNRSFHGPFIGASLSW